MVYILNFIWWTLVLMTRGILSSLYQAMYLILYFKFDFGHDKKPFYVSKYPDAKFHWRYLTYYDAIIF